jgi:ATP-binding cassette, subfamily B, multidrug efflux pump
MFKTIFKYLKGPARFFFAAAPLAMLVEVFLDLQQPTLMARIIDVGVVGRDSGFILRTGLVMVAMAIIGFAGGALCSLFAARAAVSIGGEMRVGIFERVLSLSCADMDAFKTSSLVTRCTNDVMQVQNMILMLLRGMVRTPLILFGSVIMALSLSLPLSSVFFFALPFILLSIAYVLKRAASLFSRSQANLDKVNTIMRESILGIRVTKAFSLEQRQEASFAEANESLTRSNERAQGTTFLLMPAISLAMNLCVIAILWFGGNLVKSGGLEIGKIMAFINYLLQITFAVMFLVNLVINFSRASASAERIREVLDALPSVRQPERPLEPARYDVELRDVGLSYAHAAKPALAGISLRIAENESVGIIGATGSGKSSLAALVPRLYDPVSGQVLIGGIDLREWDLPRLRRTVGLATQESVLFSGTIEDNLRFGLVENRPADLAGPEERLDAALRDSQSADFVGALQDGVKSRVEQRGRNFSGGQKQRLSIARELALDPRILIFDDTSSALDLGTESRLRAALAERRKKKPCTVITIAQRVSSIMGCDKIVVLDFGKVAAIGTHRELLGKSEIYRGIVASQLGEEAVVHA